MSDDAAAMIADIVAEVMRMYPEVSDPATAHNRCKIIGDALHERLLAAGHPSELVWLTGLRDDRRAVKPVVPEHVVVLVGGRRCVDGSLIGGVVADLTSRQHDDRLEPTALSPSRTSQNVGPRTTPTASSVSGRSASARWAPEPHRCTRWNRRPSTTA